MSCTLGSLFHTSIKPLIQIIHYTNICTTVNFTLHFFRFCFNLEDKGVTNGWILHTESLSVLILLQKPLTYHNLLSNRTIFILNSIEFYFLIGFFPCYMAINVEVYIVLSWNTWTKEMYNVHFDYHCTKL